MNKKLIPLILAGTSLLVACNNESTTTDSNDSPAVATISKADAVAVVNGQYISKASLTTLEAEISQRARGQSFPKDKLLEELIQRELLIQDAKQKQLDKSPEYIERLETIKKSLLSQQAIQNHLKSNPITDAELEAEYSKNMTESGTEYKARHILVKTEEEAKQIIIELNNGADFVELAKTKSTGPSGPQGGDLGWFSANQMVAPFSEAAIALEDGKYTVAPVQTQFGWHVILKEGTRAQTPPPFESVKEQLRPLLQRQKMQEYLDSLRTQAKIEVLLPPTEAPAPAAVTESTETPVASDSTADKAVEAKPVETITVEEVVTEVKTEVTETTEVVATDVKTETTEQANEVVVDSKDKALEAVKSAVQDTTAVAKETVDDNAPKVSDSATKTLEAVTP